MLLLALVQVNFLDADLVEASIARQQALDLRHLASLLTMRRLQCIVFSVRPQLLIRFPMRINMNALISQAV